MTDFSSHLLAYTHPHVVAYDPAFGYELAVIMRDGIQRMYGHEEDLIYYLTVQNEDYVMPDMPRGAEEGILKGMYLLQPATKKSARPVNLLASGSIINEALRAQQILGDRFDIDAAVWSITSFRQLHEDGDAFDRRCQRNPSTTQIRPWINQCLADEIGSFVIASDYIKALPNSIARWFPRPPISLGTDGFGRSDSRAALRNFFEIDAETIAYAAIIDLHRQGLADQAEVQRSISELDIDTSKADPNLV